MLRGGTGSFWLGVKSVPAMLAGYLAGAVEAPSLAAIELAIRWTDPAIMGLIDPSGARVTSDFRVADGAKALGVCRLRDRVLSLCCSDKPGHCRMQLHNVLALQSQFLHHGSRHGHRFLLKCGAGVRQFDSQGALVPCCPAAGEKPGGFEASEQSAVRARLASPGFHTKNHVVAHSVSVSVFRRGRGRVFPGLFCPSLRPSGQCTAPGP
jgi:hypothetical protein